MISELIKIGGLYRTNHCFIFYEDPKPPFTRGKGNTYMMPYIKPEDYFIILSCDDRFPLETKVLFEFRILWRDKIGKVYLAEENLLEVKE